MNIDVLIVGQGIAGTALANALEDMGKTFILFDQIQVHSSSRQAAGLINPITGRRYVKTWNYDQLEAQFLPFYKNLENKLGCSLLTVHEIILCLSSSKEENDLLSQSLIYGYSDKLEYLKNPPQGIQHQNRTAFYSLKGYKLNIPLLCDHFRKKWIDNGILKEERFNNNSLFIYEDHIQYNGIEASKLIFCEGADGTGNPYFQNMGIIPNKGQFLIIHAPELKSKASIKDKIVITPLPNKDHYWVGATYEWAFNDVGITEMARKELVMELNDLISVPYEIVDHRMGIRPTNQSRRPIILQHEKYKNIWALNGLGTKGGSLAPFAVHMLIQRIFPLHT